MEGDNFVHSKLCRDMKNQFFVLALAAISLAACSDQGDSSQSVAVPSVMTYTLTLDSESGSTNSAASVCFPGKVKASTDANLSFRVAGIVNRVYVDQGSTVRAGQLVAELDSTDYRLQLDATEAEYAQIKAQAYRVIALYQEDGTTPANYDQAVYGLQQITAKLNAHREQLGYTRLYAPFSGKVQARLVDSHEAVGAGTPVLTIVADGGVEVEIHLSASDYVNRSRYGQWSCTFDVMPGIKYPLDVISVTPQANANQLYTMRLRVGNPGNTKMPTPGMTTMVTALTSAGDGVTEWQVPGGAVFSADGSQWVYVYNPETSTVNRRQVAVTRLLANEDCVIVSANDDSSPALSAGDIIVSSGTGKLHDGCEVKLVEAVSPTNVGGLL